MMMTILLSDLKKLLMKTGLLEGNQAQKDHKNIKLRNLILHGKGNLINNFTLIFRTNVVHSAPRAMLVGDLIHHSNNTSILH